MKTFQLTDRDRILYIRLSAIGDVVNAIPGLVALRESFPNNFIAWCVGETPAAILRGHPMIDELLIVKDKWRQNPLAPENRREIGALFRRMRELNFTVAIDAHCLLKSALVARFSGAPLRVAGNFARNYEGYKYWMNALTEFDNTIKGPAAAYRGSCLRGIGVDTSRLHYVLPPLAQEVETVKALLLAEGIPTDGRRVVILNPRASRRTKEWPGEYFVELGRKLAAHDRVQLLWTGSPAERESIAALASQIRETRSVNLAGRLNLRELAALYSINKLLVTGDTGPMHIGAAAGIFVVALMGSMDPAEHGPFTDRRLILTAGLPCQYCSSRACEHVRCLTELRPERVYQSVKGLIDSGLLEN